MFKRGLNQLYRFFSPENRLGMTGGSATRVYSLYLHNVSDPFSAELLWDYNSALGDGAEGDQLLRDFQGLRVGRGSGRWCRVNG